MSRLLLFSLLSAAASCIWHNDAQDLSSPNNLIPFDSLGTVSDITPPPGFKRISAAKGSFAEWLRNISLKKDRHVYLYNGAPKDNQEAQYVVLDVSVGNKDLQQCADAIMRLRAEYLFNQGRYSEIEFRDNESRSYKWKGAADRAGFAKYLATVFSMCGTASLEKQLKHVASINELQHGDVFIRGGFPGHAMIVIDVAVNEKGRKVYMLAQSYMPAQDIHIVKNPVNKSLSPWYEVNDQEKIITPEWIFTNKQLKRW